MHLDHVISHFKHHAKARAFRKWQKNDKKLVFSTIQLRARNICRAKEAAYLTKKEMNIVHSWVMAICPDLLKMLTRVEVRDLIRGSRYTEFGDNEVIFFEGDVGTHYYILLSGACVAVGHGNIEKARRRSEHFRNMDIKNWEFKWVHYM